MKKERVRELWGHVVEIGANDESLLARQLEFPFAQRIVQGGSSLIEPTFSEIYICAQCETAKARWIESHLSHPWSQAQKQTN